MLENRREDKGSVCLRGLYCFAEISWSIGLARIVYTHSI